LSRTYTDLPNTQYPDVTSDVFETKTDATSDMQPYITQYKNYFNSGNVAAAKALLEQFPQLKNMIITAYDFNKLQDAMMAMQRFVKREQNQVLFSSTQPSGANTQSEGDIWIKPATGTAADIVKIKQSDGTYQEHTVTAKYATQLKTSRKIGDANFNGSANITLNQIGAATKAQGDAIDALTTDIKYIKYVTSLPADAASHPTTLYLVKK